MIFDLRRIMMDVTACTFVIHGFLAGCMWLGTMALLAWIAWLATRPVPKPDWMKEEKK